MLFVVIGVGYVGGALLKLRGHTATAEGAWLIAAAGFGGGIALIGQMYHLSGDENVAVLTWCAGTTLAAPAALPSAPLTVAAASIGAAWFLITWSDYFDRYGPPLPTQPSLRRSGWCRCGPAARRHGTSWCCL